jgi:hypothetical protein
VAHNTESTQRQYALRERGIALGDPAHAGNADRRKSLLW